MEAIVFGTNTEIKERHIEFYLVEELIAIDVDWNKLERLATIEHLGTVNGAERYQAFFEDEANEVKFRAILESYEEYAIDEEDLNLDSLDWE